jgi:hypothetical protein
LLPSDCNINIARIKAISRKYINISNQRSARKTPVPKSGKKIIMSRQLKKGDKKGDKKGSKGVKGNRTRLIKKVYRYKLGSKL